MRTELGATTTTTGFSAIECQLSCNFFVLA
jgi:hypothetical protein